MKIGKLISLLILGIVFLTSCIQNDDSTHIETLNGNWNVKNISGGFAGINDDYDAGIIIWTFNNQNRTLTVENNNSQESTYDGFESGIYDFSTIETNGNDYMIINNGEYGGFTISINTLIINQNETTSGSGADGFILQFEK